MNSFLQMVLGGLVVGGLMKSQSAQAAQQRIAGTTDATLTAAQKAAQEAAKKAQQQQQQSGPKSSPLQMGSGPSSGNRAPGPGPSSSNEVLYWQNFWNELSPSTQDEMTARWNVDPNDDTTWLFDTPYEVQQENVGDSVGDSLPYVTNDDNSWMDQGRDYDPTVDDPNWNTEQDWTNVLESSDYGDNGLDYIPYE